MKTWSLCVLAVITLYLSPRVEGHGYMLMPPGRSSAWRMNSTYFRVNYNDNQNYCGGYAVQHNKKNDGKCGICGDAFNLDTPRDNEIGGYYGDGNRVAEYRTGEIIDVAIVITANHWGKFYFDLCPRRGRKERETEKCFEPFALEVVNSDGQYFKIPHGDPDTFNVKLRIPNGLTCDYCTLRWKYIAANSWGCVDDRKPRTCCTGCGNKQEHFYSCADIRISRSGDEGILPWTKVDRTKTTTPRPTTTRYPSTTTTMRTTTTRRTRRPIGPTRPTTTENPVCTTWCAKMCKPHFNNFCTRKLCSDCFTFRRLLVDG